jgi:hypothetical protein
MTNDPTTSMRNMTNGSLVSATATRCDLAMQRYRNAAIWLNLWSILLFVFAIFVVGFLIYAILFLLREEWLQGGLGTLGVIVDGVAMNWVVGRRKDAKLEEAEAFGDIQNNCPQMIAAVNSLKTKYRFP